MYIPEKNLETDRERIVSFMQRFSFATIITAKENIPVATHLPFLISLRNDNVILTSHFAKANDHWTNIEHDKVLVVFSEPHAYVSPKNYEKEQNVPTWNYISVHAYGKGTIIPGVDKAFEVLEATIDQYETDYKQQWKNLPEDYKLRMLKGIVTFEVEVTDLQAKKKLSQNRSEGEKQNIIDSFEKSNDANAKIIAEYMKGE